MKEKIFISGPISGIKDFNFPNFNFWNENLESIGYEVVSPAKMAVEFGVPEQIQSNADLLYKLENMEIEELCKCNSIFLLNGWTNSNGSKRELAKAIEKNLKILEESNFSLGTVMFGEVFNPLTNAHVSIINRLLKISNKVIISIADHGYKFIELDVHSRIEMVKDHFKNDIQSGKVKIVIQNKRTWEFLKELNEKIDYIAVGNDEFQLPNADGWHFSNEIKSNYSIFNFKREKDSISSTNVRNFIKEKGYEESLLSHIPKSVFNFLKKNNIYLNK